MSYCTIEEAWGLSEPFSSSKDDENDQPQLLQDHRKKHTKKIRRKKKTDRRKDALIEKDSEYNNELSKVNEDDIEESFINSPSAVIHPNFSRSLEPCRVPDAFDVSIGNAPIDNDVAQDYLDNDPSASYTTTINYQPQQDTYRKSVPSYSKEPTTSVHEELEWMRNNMSHINDKIDKLTHSLEKRQQHTVHIQSNTQAHDTIVFVLIGVFVLVLIDIFFRAGQRL